MPYMPNLELEDEDSLSLTKKQEAGLHRAGAHNTAVLDIAVLRLPRLSNFTDMDPLLSESDVSLRYVEHAGQWGNPDAVIIPGSKNAIEDLLWLKETKLAELLVRHAAEGGWTTAICGGYEMLGRRLLDPMHVESSIGEVEGLGLFPYDVIFEAEKRTVRVEGTANKLAGGKTLPITGYEIHMGELRWHGGADCTKQPFVIREQNAAGRSAGEPSRGEGASSSYKAEGACSTDGRVWGTFIHGILHNDDLRREWLNDIRQSKGLQRLPADLRFAEQREHAFDRLAEHARRYIQIDRIYALLNMQEEDKG
ncbi:Cobyric acid synthase [compost metagenome]